MNHIAPPLDCASSQSISPVAAFDQIIGFACPVTESQSLPLDLVNGRILARDVVTPIALPPFDNSAFDGYEITAGDGRSVAAHPTVRDRTNRRRCSRRV